MVNLTNPVLVVHDISGTAFADVKYGASLDAPLNSKPWAAFKYLLRPNSKTLRKLEYFKSVVGFPLNEQTVITAHVRQPQVSDP